jgi:hypothetical protein
LVVRLIQGEPLVGDRQFWVTRPYVWYKLLAAKILFIIAFVTFPFVLSQVVLLVADHAPLGSLWGDIIERTAGTTLVVILPVAVLAVITRNLTQWVLGAFGVILIIVGIAMLDSYIPDSHVSTGNDVTETLQAIVLVCLTALGIFIQYSRRRRLHAILAVVGAVVLMPLIMVATPYRALILSAFPLVNPEQSRIEFTFVPGVNSPESGPETNDESKVRTVIIPIDVSEVPDGTILDLSGVMLSIEDSGGTLWQSPWQTSFQTVFAPKQRLLLSVDVDRGLYERVKALPTHVRIALAFKQLQDRHPRRFVIDRTFDLPDVGFCWIDRDGVSVHCRSTSNSPESLLMSSSELESTCPEARTRKASAEVHLRRILNSNSSSDPLSPLNLRSFCLMELARDGSARDHACAGTPATISAPELVGRYRLELDLGQLRLSDYRARSPLFSFR